MTNFDAHYKILIVGAGPAGLYSIEEISKQLSVAKSEVSFDVVNADAIPGGLVRYGVAPDHLKIRSLSKLFEQILERDNVRYFGNVDFGNDITLQDALSRYDAVVFSIGAQGDRKLNIPGEELRGSFSARQVVNWYNGHPSAADIEIDLSCDRAVISGAGNVAADVARILVRNRDELAQTDISKTALKILRGSNVKDVVIAVRRGPQHVKFTHSELKALTELGEIEVRFLNSHESLNNLDLKLLDKESRKNVEIFRHCLNREVNPTKKTISFLFNAAALELLPDMSGRLSQVKFRISPEGEGGSEITLSAGLFIRSVGYEVVPHPQLPYDSRQKVIAHTEGRITGEGYERCYVVGWAADGPVGIIGTNKVRARKLAAIVAQDLKEVVNKKRSEVFDLEQLLLERGVSYVSR